MREENTVCLINSNAYKALYTEKEFVALPVEITNPVAMCLFHRKEINPTDQPVYQTLLKTATDLAQRL